MLSESSLRRRCYQEHVQETECSSRSKALRVFVSDHQHTTYLKVLSQKSPVYTAWWDLSQPSQSLHTEHTNTTTTQIFMSFQKLPWKAQDFSSFRPKGVFSVYINLSLSSVLSGISMSVNPPEAAGFYWTTQQWLTQENPTGQEENGHHASGRDEERKETGNMGWMMCNMLQNNYWEFAFHFISILYVLWHDKGDL